MDAKSSSSESDSPTFDLRALADWSYEQGRVGRLAMAAFMVVIGGVIALFAYGALSGSVSISKLGLVGAAGGAYLAVLAFARDSFSKPPVAGDVSSSAVRLVYESGSEKFLPWRSGRVRIHLYEWNESARFLVNYPYRHELSQGFLSRTIPITEPFFKAILARAATSGIGVVSSIPPPRPGGLVRREFLLSSNRGLDGG